MPLLMYGQNDGGNSAYKTSREAEYARDDTYRTRRAGRTRPLRLSPIAHLGVGRATRIRVP